MTTTKPSSSDTATLTWQPSYLSTETYALGLLLLSAIFYSAMAAFVKLAHATGLSSSELVLLRALFQGIFVVASMFHFKDNHETDKPLICLPYGGVEHRHVVLARGAAGGLGFMFYYYTTSVLPLGDATTLLSLNPVITVLAAAVFLGEPVRIFDVLAALGSLVGCMLIAQPSFLFPPDVPIVHHPLSGYITAIMGTCCSSASVILIRRAGRGGIHTAQLMFSWVTFAVLFSLSVGVILPLMGLGPDPVWPSTSQSWLFVLGVSVFGCMAHVLLNFAARKAPAGLASIMRSSSILWSYLLEVLIFEQVPGWITLLGVFLIVLSLGAIAYEKHLDSVRKEAAIATKGVANADEEEPPVEMQEREPLHPTRSSVELSSADANQGKEYGSAGAVAV